MTKKAAEKNTVQELDGEGEQTSRDVEMAKQSPGHEIEKNEAEEKIEKEEENAGDKEEEEQHAGDEEEEQNAGDEEEEEEEQNAGDEEEEEEQESGNDGGSNSEEEASAHEESGSGSESEKEKESKSKHSSDPKVFQQTATRTLYVANLDKNTSEKDLKNLFKRFGEIVKIEMKVVRGIPQYGFVHFSDITSVCNAFKEMDGYKHGSSRLKLGFGRRRPTNCVWLDSLPSDMTSETLKKHYSQFGTVVEVVLDKLKHRALVLFLDTKDAIVALRRTRYWNPGGKTLMVDFSTQNGQLFFYQSMKASGQDLGDMSDLSGDESDSVEKAKTQPTSGAPKNSSSSTKDKTKSSKPSDKESRKKSSEKEEPVDEFHPSSSRILFIRNIDKEISEGAFLKDLFSKFGEIVEVEMKYFRDLATYCYLQFGDITSVCSAIKEMNGHKNMKLGFGASKPSDFLWLGGLSENITEEYLKEHFSKYGAVKQVVLDKEKRRALIHFADSKDTKTAFRESKQKKIGGKKVMVDFINQAGQLAFLLTMEESGQDISNAKSLLEKLQIETESKEPESQKAETSVIPEAKGKSVAESSESKTESRSKSAKLSSSTEKERNGAESDNNLSVYQQSASCCLYATNLDSSYELADLRRLFRGFGQILGGDIKVIKGVRVAFLQFGDILGVLKAINKMNGRAIGTKKIKLAFGRSRPTTCLWVDDLSINVTERKLMAHFSQYGPVAEVILDQIEGRALILFVEVAAAVRAFKDTKIRNVFGKRVMCDYANDTLKRSFCKNMEASGQTVGKSWKLSYSAGDERELSSAYYDYSADRSYFSPVRESYQEEYPFEQRSRSRDVYSEANSYSSDYRGSRYNDAHYGMSAYAGVREYSDMHRGLKRKRDWAESVYDRPYF